MVLAILFLIGGIFLLIKGSDIFVDGSSNLAKIFKISEMLIGLTVVCIGTSLPELFISISGSLKGETDIITGNMVGTNMFNMCVILGFVAIINPVKFLKDTVRKDMYMSVVTIITFFLVSMDVILNGMPNNMITRSDGIILILMFGIFMYYTVYQFGGFTDKRRQKKQIKDKIKNGEIVIQNKKFSKQKKRKILEQILICIIGTTLVYVGSECTIYGAVKLANLLHLSKSLIAILVVAVGTSLPEIATSIVAIKKGSINIAIGNLIGSNMYNVLFVAGVASVINPIKIITPYLYIDFAFFFLTLILIINFAKLKFINKGEYEISRIEGFILLTVYIAYIIFAIIRG